MSNLDLRLPVAYDDQRRPVPLPGELADLLRGHVAQTGSVTLVFAPTSITHTAPSPSSLDVRIPPAVRDDRRRYSLGEVLGYCGTTALGSSGVTMLAMLLFRSPAFAGVLAGIGALVALTGAVMVNREQDAR